MDKLLILLSVWFCIGSVAYADNVPSSPIIIFVSFSMPDKSIKGWMQEAKKIHAPVVIRGLINNSFKETLKKMAALSQDNHGVQLDPMLFKKYHITQVPAVVVRNNDHFHVIYGDVHLDYILKKLSAEQDGLSTFSEQALRMG